MSRVDGVLVVSLTHKWFDMIASGEKLEEYRGKNWWVRLSKYVGCAADLITLDGCIKSPQGLRPFDFHPYHTLRAQRAYSGVWLERKIKRIRWGIPRPEWSGNTVTGECFVIELDTSP